MEKVVAVIMKLGIQNKDRKIFYPERIALIDGETHLDNDGNEYLSIVETDENPVGFLIDFDALEELFGESDPDKLANLYLESLEQYNIIKNNDEIKMMYNGDTPKIMEVDEFTEHYLKHVNTDNDIIDFDAKKLYTALKENVFEQDEAIKKITVALSLHYNDTEEKHKSNIIIDGGKATGKTTIINTLKEVLPVSVLVEDLGDPNFSFDSLFLSLYNRNDISSCPILVFDNADKLLLNKDVSYATESTNIIKKIMLGVDYKLATSTGTINYPTNDFVIILMGDFRKRRRCGMENYVEGVPEQLSVLTNYNIKLNGMTKTLVLKKLLNDKNGVFMHYTNYLSNLGINLKKSEELVDKIVDETLKTNMHELDKIVDKCFEDVLFEVYTSDKEYTNVSMDKNILNDSKKYILK